MTDKDLKELQDIIHDAFMLQSRIHAWMYHLVEGGDGAAPEVLAHHYGHLRDAYDHITGAINLMMDETEEEMKRREGK